MAVSSSTTARAPGAERIDYAAVLPHSTKLLILGAVPRSAEAAKSRRLCRRGYATWNDRLARPYQNPSTVKSGAVSGSRAAPSVTNSGAKWSMVGWA